MQSKYPNPFTHPPKLFTPEELRALNQSVVNSRNGRSGAEKVPRKGSRPVDKVAKP